MPATITTSSSAGIATRATRRQRAGRVAVHGDPGGGTGPGAYDGAGYGDGDGGGVATGCAARRTGGSGGSGAVVSSQPARRSRGSGSCGIAAHLLGRGIFQSTSYAIQYA